MWPTLIDIAVLLLCHKSGMSRNTLGTGWLEYRREDTQQEGIGQGNGGHMRQKRGKEDTRHREEGQEGKEDKRN